MENDLELAPDPGGISESPCCEPAGRVDKRRRESHRVNWLSSEREARDLDEDDEARDVNLSGASRRCIIAGRPPPHTLKEETPTCRTLVRTAPNAAISGASRASAANARPGRCPTRYQSAAKVAALANNDGMPSKSVGEIGAKKLSPPCTRKEGTQKRGEPKNA